MSGDRTGIGQLVESLLAGVNKVEVPRKTMSLSSSRISWLMKLQDFEFRALVVTFRGEIETLLSYKRAEPLLGLLYLRQSGQGPLCHSSLQVVLLINLKIASRSGVLEVGREPKHRSGF